MQTLADLNVVSSSFFYTGGKVLFRVLPLASFGKSMLEVIRTQRAFFFFF